MDARIIYKLQPGDTIYLVTRDREIKAITLTEDHLGLVNEFEHDYTNKPCYYSDRGILHKDVIKREASFSYRPLVTETNIWLLGDSDNEESPKSEQEEPKEKLVDQPVADAIAEVKKRIAEARKKLI